MPRSGFGKKQLKAGKKSGFSDMTCTACLEAAEAEAAEAGGGSGGGGGGRADDAPSQKQEAAPSTFTPDGPFACTGAPLIPPLPRLP